jgi:hypothetical protein
LTDHLATVLAARYAAALSVWDGEVTDEFRRTMRTLHGLCQDIVELGRGVHSGARLNLEQERLEREREKTEEEVVEHFKRWAKNPEVRDWICRDWVSPEERERRLRVIFGREPEPPDETSTDGLESSPGNGQEPGSIKPNQTKSNQIKPNENASAAKYPCRPRRISRQRGCAGQLDAPTQASLLAALRLHRLESGLASGKWP